MIMNSFWCFCVLISTLCALPSGRAGAIAGALIDGASSAVTVSIAIAGPLCLWNGLGHLMERVGMQFEGFARESMRIKGRYRTIGTCGILRREFEEGNG